MEAGVVLLPDREDLSEEMSMYLCEYCEEGQLEMCQYFKEHFLERDCPAVTACPKFKERKEDEDGDT